MNDICDKAESVSYEIDKLKLSALSWGPQNGTPILALHGWLDHAGSFMELASYLPNCHLIALDLTGHGESNHRSADATYNIWDDLPQIFEFLDCLNWQTCTVLGHSRGAMIAALMAAVQPHRVDALVTLDGLMPSPTRDTEIVDTMRGFLEQTKSLKKRAPSHYATVDEFVLRRQKTGTSKSASEKLAKRAIAPKDGRFHLKSDARLKARSAVKLNQRQIETILASILCPTLCLWADQGLHSLRPWSQDIQHKAEEVMPNLEQITLPGDHHFHLDSDHAQQIGSHIQDFLARHAIISTGT